MTLGAALQRPRPPESGARPWVTKPNHRTIGEAIREVLRNRASDAVHAPESTARFAPGMTMEQTVDALEIGGFEFKARRAARSTHAALLQMFLSDHERAKQEEETPAARRDRGGLVSFFLTSAKSCVLESPVPQRRVLVDGAAENPQGRDGGMARAGRRASPRKGKTCCGTSVAGSNPAPASQPPPPSRPAS